jgi:glycogen debranching enzyme
MQCGVSIADGATIFVVRAPLAEAVSLCLFENARETHIAMTRVGDNWVASLAGDRAGLSYGYRASGRWAPSEGYWFDPAKLLVDPFAVTLDRPFVQNPALARYGEETATIVPRAIVTRLEPLPLRAPRFRAGGLIYELNIRGFTAVHPDIPNEQRGTVAALAHPAVIAHFQKLGVNAVELMPIVAWIDERHLPPLGLSNAWGYNPVVPMALDPRLCPGGIIELRDTISALHDAGIDVILDIVLNHSGESDIDGGQLSLRGLDNSAYAHGADGRLINDSGCGNIFDFANPAMRTLALATLRHFVNHCGVDGFRFDLATVMARGPGFDPEAPLLAAIAADPVLSSRVMIAEPWDVGPGGYQLGHFPSHWLEWNDRFRDDVRSFWRGDGTVGTLATRIAGSSDIFGAHCRSVNFLAAHDGFTLADTVAYCERHNHANGEDNRDGHGDNRSWNHGVEGPSDDPAVLARRDADVRAMLATLFASTGTIMLTAGDECGRSQQGNNNAYCQAGELGWFDWINRDQSLEDYVAYLSRQRAARGAANHSFPEHGHWLHPDGQALSVAQWNDQATDGFDFHPAPGCGLRPISIRRQSRMVSF